MIAEDCKSLRLQLEQVSKAKLNEQIVNQLSERRKDLLQLKEKVVTAVVSLQAIANRTSIVGKLDATKALDRVQKLREALKSDPQSITKGRDLTYMTSAFEKFADEASKATELTWDQYLPRARPNVDANRIAQAEQQEAFKTKAIQLKARVKHAEQTSKHPPLTEAEFVELEAVWEDIRELLEALPAVTNDPKVREFLKAANSPKGASLDLLTEEVIIWLRENNTYEKYRIVNL
jgi:hypothetical protein